MSTKLSSWLLIVAPGGKTLNSVILNGTVLERVTKYEYLGVIIEENLTWSKHVIKLISRSENKIYTFSGILKYIDQYTADLLMKTYILPRLGYGGLFLMGAKKTGCK